MVDPPYKDVALKVWRVSKKVEGVTKKVGGSGHPDPPSGCALGHTQCATTAISYSHTPASTVNCLNHFIWQHQTCQGSVLLGEFGKFFLGGESSPRDAKNKLAGGLSRPTIVYDGDQTGTPDGVSQLLSSMFFSSAEHL